MPAQIPDPVDCVACDSGPEEEKEEKQGTCEEAATQRPAWPFGYLFQAL